MSDDSAIANSSIGLLSHQVHQVDEGPSSVAPIVYEDRIRISRSKFESLFGWKTASTIDDDNDSGAEGDGAPLSQQIDAENNGQTDGSLMPSCICEIMRENRVTVVPSFRKGANFSTTENQQLPQTLQTVQTDSHKNKRDYILRIFGDNESDVAAAKFKIQSAVHQVAVMGATPVGACQQNGTAVGTNSSNSQSSATSARPFFAGSSSSLAGLIGGVASNGNGAASGTDSANQRANQQWWSNVCDRLTLRVDVDYTVHSHLIGRNGGNIASVMRATQTHIHFPDSNKQSSSNRSSGNANGSRSASPSLPMTTGFSASTPIKNNYVTISGPGVEQVDEARQYIRRMTPLRLAIPFSTLNVPLSLTGQVFVPARLAASSRRVMQEYCDRGLSAVMRSDSLVVSGTMSIADLIIQATQQICLEVYECLVPVSLSVDVTPRDWAFVRGPGDCYTRKIEHATGCQFVFPSPGLEDARSLTDGRRQPVRIVGFPANAVKARLLLQARLPIQLSWPLRSQVSGNIQESDAALKEIVATRYDIFLTMRDRSSGRNAAPSSANNGRESGSATPDITIGSSTASSNKMPSNCRPASSGAAAAYHMVQPKHVVLKSFEGNLPNVYRFYAYMRDLNCQNVSSKSSSRAASRLDDGSMITSAPPTPPQSPSWWSPLPSDVSDDELFQKVDALVHEGFLLASRSNPTFGAGNLPTSANLNFLSAATLGNALLANVPTTDPQVFYTAYALALAQQQQQQQQQTSAAVLAAFTSGWNSAALMQPCVKPQSMGLLGRPNATTAFVNAASAATAQQQPTGTSRVVLSQRNSEQNSSQQFSPRSIDDGASSPESNSSGSVENYNIVIDEKSVAPPLPYHQQPRSSSSHDFIPEGRAITAASRIFGQQTRSFESNTSAPSNNNNNSSSSSSKDVTDRDRLLEQFAASLSLASGPFDQQYQQRSAVIVSAESHKIYEIPRRNDLDKLPGVSDPIASGILRSVIGNSSSNSSTTPQSVQQQQANGMGQQQQQHQQQHLRVPTSNNCGMLFSLSQPAVGMGAVGAPVDSTNPASSILHQHPAQPSHRNVGADNYKSALTSFGASSIVVGGSAGGGSGIGDQNGKASHSPDQMSSLMMGSIGAELMASRANSASYQGRNLSITGGFASKLQSTELYYEQFADQIDKRLGDVLFRAGVARSDIGKLASQEVKYEAFLAMSESDLRDCGIWQLGVRRQLLRIISTLHCRPTSTVAIDTTTGHLLERLPNDDAHVAVSDADSSPSNQRLLVMRSANSSRESSRSAAQSDPLPLSSSPSNSNNRLASQPPAIEISDQPQQSQSQSQSQQQQQQQHPQQQLPSHQLPPQSPPFFASLKTYKLESEFRLL